jgi:hypothetical protein
MLLAARALGACLAVAVAITAPVAGASKTAVVIFQPWANGTLGSGFIVSGKAQGSCFTHSLSTDRPDAWRCFEGNDILDPCFAQSPHSDTVACAESPFSKHMVLLSLKKRLTDGDNATTKWLQPKGMPWGLLLTNGDTCVFATGATDAVGGERLNYACRKTGWIVGAPDRSTAVWKARSVNWPDKRVTRVRIATAVF